MSLNYERGERRRAIERRNSTIFGCLTLGIAIDEMIFIGDALFPGGNDYPAKQAGVVSIQVRDPNETKRVVETILACLGGAQPTSIAPAKTS